MNVLIVDDQASQRAIVRHLIQDIGADIKINEFADPVEALLFTEQEPQEDNCQADPPGSWRRRHSRQASLKGPGRGKQSAIARSR